MRASATRSLALLALILPCFTGVAGEQSVQQTNDEFVQKISKQIAGHEQEPAGKVFKNIQMEFLKKAPAARLLLIMNRGYSHALGVTCTHCHVEDDFSKDDKRPKRAAREMAAMHFAINQQLAKMENLEPNPEGHFVNCDTCHRGAVNPIKASVVPAAEVVRQFYTTVMIGRDVDAAPRFLKADYIQHNAQVPTGLKGFMDTFRARFAQKMPADYKRELLNVVGQGDMVVTYVRQTWTSADGQHHQALGFDMFRVEGDKIAEHWDAD